MASDLDAAPIVLARWAQQGPAAGGALWDGNVASLQVRGVPLPFSPPRLCDDITGPEPLRHTMSPQNTVHGIGEQAPGDVVFNYDPMGSRNFKVKRACVVTTPPENKTKGCRTSEQGVAR